MRSARIIHATAVLLLASCSPLFQECSLAVCQDGLVVELGSTTNGPLRVEAWSELRIAPQVFDCPAANQCRSAFFQDFQGENVTVRVTTDAGTRTQEFTGVDYDAVYPNGRDCPGRCRQAKVTFPL